MALYNKKQTLQQAHAQQNWNSVPDQVFEKLGVSRQQMTDLQMKMQGWFVFPDSPNYDRDRAGNPLYPAYPQVIAYCVTPQDVRYCLDLAHTQNLWVTC